jgi:hypothetical protein
MKRIQRTWILGAVSALLVWNCQNEENAPADLVSGGVREQTPNSVPMRTGQATITLPDIPAENLAKAGVVSASGDTLGWFHLVITWNTGEGIKKAFPILDGLKGQIFLVTDLPVGDKCQFQGFITNKDGVLRYQGTSFASIVSGQTANVVLRMGPPTGSASICVTVDGVASSTCDTSTIEPPPIKEPLPPTDTVVVPADPVAFECYYLGGAWKMGQLRLVPLMMSSRRSWFVLDNGDSLLVQDWRHEKDIFEATILANNDFTGEKWVIRGKFPGTGYWEGTVQSTTTKASYSVYGKTLPCPEIGPMPPKDTSAHKDTVIVVDPSDRLPQAVLPLPTNPEKVTVCAEIRLDYGTACEASGFLKMDVSAGKIQYGYLLTASNPSSEFASLSGHYSMEKIDLMGVSGSGNSTTADTLVLDGYMGGLGEAKGGYTLLPLNKRGNWHLRFTECGNAILTPPAANCSAP